MSEDPHLQALRRLTGLMRQYGLTELEVREDGVSIRLRSPEAAEPLGRAPVPRAPLVGSGPPSTAAGPPPERLHMLVAPLTGTFYRAASPEAPPFVEVGSPVQPGQTVGLIEAMKLFSEVPADVSGTVYAIYAENGRLVQQGERLLAILLPEE